MSNDPAPVGGVVTEGRAPLRVSARVCVVLGALAVGLLLAEAGLRAGGFSYRNLYTEDPEVGFALRPGADGSGHWNSAGHRVVGDLVAGRLCETLTHDR